MEDLTENAEKAASRNKCESSKQSTDCFVQERVVQAFPSFWHLRKTKIEAEIFGGDMTRV